MMAVRTLVEVESNASKTKLIHHEEHEELLISGLIKNQVKIIDDGGEIIECRDDKIEC